MQALNQRNGLIPSSATALSTWTRHATSVALLLVIAANFFVRGGHDIQRALEVVFLLVIGSAMVARTSALCAALPRGTVLRYSLCGFFALGTVASFAAFSPRFAFYEVASLLLLLLVGLVVADELAAAGTNSVVGVLQVLGGICLLYGFKLAVVYCTAFAFGNQPDANDMTTGFNNYRFFNHTQTLSLPLLVALLGLAPTGARIRWAWLLLAALWWALLAVTSARGTVFGLAAGCMVALALRGRHAFPFLKMMAWSAIAGTAFYCVFFILIPEAAGFGPVGELAHTAQRTAADPASGRIALWQRAFELIAADPLFGAGPLHFAHQAPAVQLAAHPHNWVVQVAAEWGLPALLCLCIAIGAAARALVRTGARIETADARNQQIFTAMLVAGVALLADGLVSGSLVMPQSQLMIALYIGCAAGWSRSVGPARAPAAMPAKAAHRALAALVVVAAMLGLAGGVWPELVPRLTQEPMTAQQQAANPPTVYWPRLWRAGFF